MTIVHSDADAQQHRPHHHAHRGVGNKRGMRCEIPLQHPYDQRHQGGAENGAYHEPFAQEPVAACEKQDVGAIHGHRHGHSLPRGIEYQGAEARHPADHDLMGEDKHGESYGIDHYSDYDVNDITQLIGHGGTYSL